jgi:hypothetical protein
MAKLPVTNSPSGPESRETNPNASQAAICRQVMTVLGRPIDFLRITVRQITSEAYRVNVVAGADMATARIAHSYFITADEGGNIVGADPALVKKY